jgi:hypothetical protein
MHGRMSGALLAAGGMGYRPIEENPMKVSEAMSAAGEAISGVSRPGGPHSQARRAP